MLFIHFLLNIHPWIIKAFFFLHKGLQLKGWTSAGSYFTIYRIYIKKKLGSSQDVCSVDFRACNTMCSKFCTNSQQKEKINRLNEIIEIQWFHDPCTMSVCKLEIPLQEVMWKEKTQSHKKRTNSFTLYPKWKREDKRVSPTPWSRTDRFLPIQAQTELQEDKTLLRSPFYSIRLQINDSKEPVFPNDALQRMWQ